MPDTTEKDVLLKMIHLMDLYENTDRVSIALNVLDAVEAFTGMKRRKAVCEWVGSLSGYSEYKTVYSWLSPHRESKVPFKVLLKIAVATGCPVERLLKKKDCADRVMLKERASKKTNMENAVRLYVHAHPEDSLHDIALNLAISEVTVRRHLEHLGLINDYLTKKKV